jgi:hypothetical protein
VNRAYVGRVLGLTLLAPELVEAILEGREPPGGDYGGADGWSGGEVGEAAARQTLQSVSRSWRRPGMGTTPEKCEPRFERSIVTNHTTTKETTRPITGSGG